MHQLLLDVILYELTHTAFCIMSECYLRVQMVANLVYCVRDSPTKFILQDVDRFWESSVNC